jgi:hypothetical protein
MPATEPATDPVAGAPRASRAPWITATVAGLVLVGLIVTYLAFLRGDIHDADRQRAANRHLVVGDLNAEESRAVDAAATEMLNLVSFRRANFEADWQRALDGVTGAVRSDVAKKKQLTLNAMTKGKFDLDGRVTHKALEGPVGSGKKRGYTVLVTIEGYRSTAPDAALQQNFEVTVVRSGNRWLASAVSNIGIG